MSKLSDFISEIMEQMEQRGFTQGEAELVPKFLTEYLSENSKRLEKNKPFAVFRYPRDATDNI
jgi:hypothetical protein